MKGIYFKSDSNETNYFINYEKDRCFIYLINSDLDYIPFSHITVNKKDLILICEIIFKTYTFELDFREVLEVYYDNNVVYSLMECINYSINNRKLI